MTRQEKVDVACGMVILLNVIALTGHLEWWNPSIGRHLRPLFILWLIASTAACFWVLSKNEPEKEDE